MNYIFIILNVIYPGRLCLYMFSEIPTSILYTFFLINNYEFNNLRTLSMRRLQIHLICFTRFNESIKSFCLLVLLLSLQLDVNLEYHKHHYYLGT